MSLYIPKMSDTPGVTIPGLAGNFSLLEDSLVEYGSNENGEYWRWENGLQICYKESPSVGNVEPTLQAGGFYRSRIGDYLDLSFPATFVSAPYQNCLIDVRRGTDSVPIVSIYRGMGEISSLSSWLNFLVSSYGEHNYYRVVRLLAIGRWK